MGDVTATTPPRAARRRAETIQRILAIAVEVMAAEGVAALSLSDVARRLGIQPPSLYKYFPSKLALYDAVFEQGARGVRDGCREAIADSRPGMPALSAVLERLAHFVVANPVYAQLLYWRPVPGFTPSPQAYLPAQQFQADIAAVLHEAVRRGHLHADAATEDGQTLLFTLVAGALTQQLANQPHADADTGRYVRLLPRLRDMFVATFPPP